MNKFYEFIFTDQTHLEWSGDDAVTFLAIAMLIIMLSSLIITHWVTTPKATSKGKVWIPTSSNIKPNMKISK